MIKKNLLGITDLDLVTDIQNEQAKPDRDRPTTIAFWREYSNYGFKYLRKKFQTIVADDCVDIATNAVEKMYLRILNGGYQPQPTALSQSYYITICSNDAIKFLKKQNRLQSTMISDDLLEDLSEDEDQLEWQVEEMLSELEKMSPSPECMALIYAKYLDGRSHEELAHDLNISTQSSKTKLSRCMARLRKAIRASQNNLFKNLIKK